MFLAPRRKNSVLNLSRNYQLNESSMFLMYENSLWPFGFSSGTSHQIDNKHYISLPKTTHFRKAISDKNFNTICKDKMPTVAIRVTLIFISSTLLIPINRFFYSIEYFTWVYKISSMSMYIFGS